MIDYNTLVPEPQDVAVLPNSFSINSETKILINDPNAGSHERRAAFMVRDEIQKTTGLTLAIASWADTDVTNSIVLGRMLASASYREKFLPIASIKGVNDNTFSSTGFFSPSASPSEDYVLYNTHHGTFILLAGRTMAGTFLGAQTLIQICRQSLTPTQLTLERSKIRDFPKLALRGSLLYIQLDSTLMADAGIGERLRYFASLKLNTVLVMCGARVGNDPVLLEQLRQFFDLCRLYRLEPVPVIGTLGWSHEILELDADLFEGLFKESKFTFPDNDSDLTAVPVTTLPPTWNLQIQTPDALKLFNTQTGAQYRYGPDFTVPPNALTFKFNNGQPLFTTNGSIPTLQRKTTGQIAKGTKVTLRYSVAELLPGPRQPYCPYEPRVIQTFRPLLQKIIETLHPKMIHMAGDEILRKGACSRCKGQPHPQIVAKALTDLFNLVSEFDPNIKCLFWADMLNPYDSALIDPDGPPHSTHTAVELLPRSDRLILVPWAYEENYRPVTSSGWPVNDAPNLLNFIKNTYRHFNNVNDYSYQCIGTSAGERIHAAHWWCHKSQGEPNALGVIHTSWAGSSYPVSLGGEAHFNGVPVIAAFAWKGAAPNLGGEAWPPYTRLHAGYYGPDWTINAPGSLEFAEINYRYGEYQKPWTEFTFNHRTNHLGWTAANNIDIIVIAQDKLFLRANGPDPFIISADWLGIPAAQFKSIEIRMQLWHGGQGQVFFTTEAQPNFSEAQSAKFSLRPGPEPQLYQIDMRNVPSWQGTIRRLRLDPLTLPQGVTEAGIEVYSIRALP